MVLEILYPDLVYIRQMCLAFNMSPDISDPSHKLLSAELTINLSPTNHFFVCLVRVEKSQGSQRLCANVRRVLIMESSRDSFKLKIALGS